MPRKRVKASKASGRTLSSETVIALLDGPTVNRRGLSPQVLYEV
jgi:hypothetical protein